jgi:hypothetical protein
MTHDFLSGRPERLGGGSTPRRRGVAIGVAIAATALGLAGALWLGSWAFDMRRYSYHVGRLERLQEKKPEMALVERAFAEEEGTQPLAKADTESELREVAARHAGASAALVVEKGRHWSRTRVFAAPDMLYFIFFDEQGVMCGFTVVSR